MWLGHQRKSIIATAARLIPRSRATVVPDPMSRASSPGKGPSVRTPSPFWDSFAKGFIIGTAVAVVLGVIFAFVNIAIA